jgi:hypothetical protein
MGEKIIFTYNIVFKIKYIFLISEYFDSFYKNNKYKKYIY